MTSNSPGATKPLALPSFVATTHNVAPTAPSAAALSSSEGKHSSALSSGGGDSSVSSRAGAVVPSPMRGGDPAHSGRTTATGPKPTNNNDAQFSHGTGQKSVTGQLKQPQIKWNWGNITNNGPTSYESIPAVSATGHVLAVGSYGSNGGNKVSIMHALDLETGKLLWNYTMNGTVWASPLLVQAHTSQSQAHTTQSQQQQQQQQQHNELSEETSSELAIVVRSVVLSLSWQNLDETIELCD
eukprot:COSAG06_NODE_2631_length_6549_cov_4.290078_7_plen_241_part_00